MAESVGLPKELELDLWAKVIIAKNIQTDEPILGTYDEHDSPQPYVLTVTGLKKDEIIMCVNDFKVIFDASNIIEDFICTSKVIVTIPFKAFFWVKTTIGYNCVEVSWIFRKTIPLTEFKKMDGTPISQQEFQENVDQSNVVVKNYQLDYVNLLDKEECSTDKQNIEIILTATIIDKLGKYQDVIVYGFIPDE